jgi:hypothetical protein
LLVSIPVGINSEAITPVTYETVVQEVTWTFDTLLPHLAEKYNQDEKLARKIIECESSTKYDAVHENKNEEGEMWSRDWSYWQINDYWHLKEAKRQNYDIVNSWQDNLEYGFKLLAKDGAMKHWKASSYCWDK